MPSKTCRATDPRSPAFRFQHHYTRRAHIHILSLVTLTSTLIWSATTHAQSAYEQNLQLIQGSSIRNTNHDNSRWRDTPMRNIRQEDHLGPRSEYLGNPGGNSEQHFPDPTGGQFRISCEFSHFAYDDPLVFPNGPGRSHLHMFWGNTDVNAYSTYDTLLNSGSSTCNGQELNRTGYWAPAMFDADGNIRIPMRIVVYYKGYGAAVDNAAVYPPEAAMIASTNYHTAPPANDTSAADASFMCTNQFRRQPRLPKSSTSIPVCSSQDAFTEVLEMHVKFPNCWNWQDAGNPDNWSIGSNGWGGSLCGDKLTTPNIEYIIQYPLEDDETTAGWYLASDVNMMTLQQDKVGGASVHADWWGAWNADINRIWIDNCATFKIDGVPTGCGVGYLSNGGPDNRNPLPGPALKFRPQYDGPIKVAASTLFNELCETDRRLNNAAEAAICIPMGDMPDNDACDVAASSSRFTLQQNVWAMLSLPCTPPEGATVADVFADDVQGRYGTDWIIYTFDNSRRNQPYVNPGLNGTLTSGQGFWMIQKTQTSAELDLPAGSTLPDTDNSSACSSTDGCVGVNLGRGDPDRRVWSMVGNPWPDARAPRLSDLRVVAAQGNCSGANGCTPAEASAQGVTALPFFRYNGSTYDSVTSGAGLEPWAAYWVARQATSEQGEVALTIPRRPAARAGS